MTEEIIRAQVREAFKLARRHLYDIYKAERSCELRDRAYNRFDGRGMHAASLEVGRMYALTELMPELHDEFSELHSLRLAAREDAQAEWREEVFAEFLPKVDDEEPVA